MFSLNVLVRNVNVSSSLFKVGTTDWLHQIIPSKTENEPLEWKQLLHWNVLSLFGLLPWPCILVMKTSLSFQLSRFQLFPKQLIQFRFFPNMLDLAITCLLSVYPIASPTEAGDYVAFSKAHVSAWNPILGSLALRLLSVLTTKPTFRHPSQEWPLYLHTVWHSLQDI